MTRLRHDQGFVPGHAAGSSYWIGSRATEFGVGDSGTDTQVPQEDGLVWAALHQDAIVVQWPDRTGPLAGQAAAALFPRGGPRKLRAGGIA